MDTPRMFQRPDSLLAAFVLALFVLTVSPSVHAQSTASDRLVTLTFRSAVSEPVDVLLDSLSIGATPIHFMAHPARTYVFSYRRSGYASQTDTIVLHSIADSTIDIRLAKAPAIATNRETRVSVFATPSEAKIYLDDKVVSTGSLSKYALEAGPHRLTVRDDRTGREASILTTPSADELSVYRARLGVNSVERGILAAVVPGSAQLFDKEYLKGTAMLVGCAGLGYFTVRSHAEYLDRRNAYDNAWTQYIAAPTEDEAFRRRHDVEAKKTDLDHAYARSTIALGVFAACYIYSFADALLGHLATDEIEVIPAADMALVPPGVPVSAIPVGAQIKVKL